MRAAVAAPQLRTRHVTAVVACHFTGALAALGLPPYLPRLLPHLGDPQARWAGVLYVLPTAMTAVSAPLWGRLADRYGRKRLLLRAQLGLVVAFLAASQVASVPALAAVLAAQGLLGGTFAATGAYLAAGLDGTRLARALTAAQASARAALVVAPGAAGLLAGHLDVRGMYAVAAAGPLAAAALTVALPEPRPEAAAGERLGDPKHSPGSTTSLRLLCVLEATFVLSTVVTFPYLLPVVAQVWPEAGPAMAGALFGLPHVCYLLAAPFALRMRNPKPGLVTGFGLVALGAAAHPAAVAWSAPAVLVGGRLLLGAGLTCGLVALAKLTAMTSETQSPGRLFGTVETWSKGGAVVAGLAASLLAGFAGPAVPALFGAAIAAVSIPLVYRRSR